MTKEGRSQTGDFFFCISCQIYSFHLVFNWTPSTVLLVKSQLLLCPCLPSGALFPLLIHFSHVRLALVSHSASHDICPPQIIAHGHVEMGDLEKRHTVLTNVHILRVSYCTT